MDENNRNFILAIVLSIGVLFAWQFFFVPKPQPGAGAPTAEQQQQQQQQPSRVRRNRKAARHIRRRAAARRTGRRHHDPRGGARAKPAHRHRHAEPQRLDRAERRAHRRSDADRLSRDGRAHQPECRAAVAGRRAASLLRRAWLGGRGRQGCEPARPRHALDGGAGHDADAAIAGDAHLRQRQRASNSRAPSRSTTNTCSRSTTRWPTPAPRR